MISHSLAGGIELRFSERGDGDFAGPAPRIDVMTRDAVAVRSFVDQQHTSRFVWARWDDATAAVAPVADALGTARTRHGLAVRVADCAPIALFGATAGVAMVHAGWRGLRDGVVARAVDALRSLDADLTAYIGPCIRSECYEFGEPDLDVMADRFGPGVRATTQTGAPALDLVATASAALARAGVKRIEVEEACTACDAARFYSHRARRDPQRHALVAWRR